MLEGRVKPRCGLPRAATLRYAPRMLRQTALFGSLLVAFTLAGCPTQPPEELPDAYRVRRDAGPGEGDGAVAMDGAVEPQDGAVVGPDGESLDAPIERDAGGRDAFALDAHFDFDTGPCWDFTADSGLGACDCLSLGPDCSTEACPSGMRCVDDGCGQHCKPSGATCATSADCPSGSTCDAGGRCVRTDASCASSMDCPPGFSCDAGSCADRRIGCTASDFDRTCPYNFVCSVWDGAPYCVRAMPRCVSDANCGPGASCVDVEGDGAKECVRAGLCASNAICAGMDGTCGTEPSRLSHECLPLGLCRVTADCPSGHECVDLWGDGQRECVEAGGSCASQADCPEGQLCGSPYEGGGPPRCLDEPLAI